MQATVNPEAKSANAGTDLAFSDPVDLLQGVPETTTSPVDQNSKDGLALRNRVIADSTSEVTSESDVSNVLAVPGAHSVGKSVRTTTLKAIAVVSLMLSAWFGLNRPAIDSAAMSPAVAEMTANLADQSPRWDSVAIQDVVTGQFVTVGLPDGESKPLPEDTLTEKAPKQDATGVTEWLEYPADEFVSFPIRIAVRDGVIVDVDGKDSNASLKNLISTKYVVGDADGTDVTRLLCRTIDLEMRKPDGSIAELSVIRPLWWLQGTGAAVGGSIDIGLHEIGLSGEATVLAIGPCDVDSRETRPGMSIVTGTIRHLNATVWNLTFDDQTEETLGVSANHPLYSETRHAWIPAGDLQLDEVVRTLNGHSTLTARTQRPTRATVFNLEVHRSHAYHVSAIGVLAHNTGLPCPPGGTRQRGPNLGQQQGREFRVDSLELYEFDPKVPKPVRGWLENERRRIAGSGGGPLTPRNPPGYVQGHGRTTPAREGFDYSNSRLQGEDLNKLEESIRRRAGRP